MGDDEDGNGHDRDALGDCQPAEYVHHGHVE